MFVKSAVIKVEAKIHQSLTSVPTPRVRVVHRVSFCLDSVMSEVSQFSTFILFTFLLVVRIKLSTQLRRGRRALMAEIISALAAILDQGCIPLAELEITAGAKLHF